MCIVSARIKKEQARLRRFIFYWAYVPVFGRGATGYKTGLSQRPAGSFFCVIVLTPRPSIPWLTVFVQGGFIWDVSLSHYLFLSYLHRVRLRSVHHVWMAIIVPMTLILIHVPQIPSAGPVIRWYVMRDIIQRAACRTVQSHVTNVPPGSVVPPVQPRRT